MGTAVLELSQQMAPFVAHLATGHRDEQLPMDRAYFTPIEAVAPPLGFAVNHLQITGERREWLWMLPESCELGVMPVAASAAAKYCLRQQRLAPKCYQAPRIEIFGMQRPKPHELST